MEKLKHTDDQVLLLLIQEEDYMAFDELYNRYWKKLYMIACKKTGCKEDAMDLVQDLFIEFWNKRKSIAITSSLGTYLVSCLYHKTFHYFRAKGLQDKYVRNFQEFLQQSNQFEYSSSSVLLHETELEYELLQEMINQAIEEMPEKMREVFHMTRTGELSVAEVAAALSISPQTVKNQVGNAMKRLKKVVNEHAFELPVSMLIILLLNK
jgi:RNA polymerase sigma-70 factor (ECF subfamily)